MTFDAEMAAFRRDPVGYAPCVINWGWPDYGEAP
jgi:hypothetical protein